MKPTLPFIDIVVPAPIELNQNHKLKELINSYYYSLGKMPLSEEIMKACKKAHERCGMQHVHKLTIRCYADGTQELMGPRARNRSQMRRKPRAWAWHSAPRVFRS